MVTEPDGEAAEVFNHIAATIDVDLAPTRIYRSELRIG